MMGWILHGRSCYKLLIEENATLGEAKIKCDSHKSAVVSIEEDAELEFVAGFSSSLGVKIWTGAKRNLKNGRKRSPYFWNSGLAVKKDWYKSDPRIKIQNSCAWITIS